MTSPVALRAADFYPAIVTSWRRFRTHGEQCERCANTVVAVNGGGAEPSTQFRVWHSYCCSEGKPLLEEWKTNVDAAILAYRGGMRL